MKEDFETKKEEKKEEKKEKLKEEKEKKVKEKKESKRERDERQRKEREGRGAQKDFYDAAVAEQERKGQSGFKTVFNKSGSAPGGYTQDDAKASQVMIDFFCVWFVLC